jgi:hypothetical protein
MQVILPMKTVVASSMAEGRPGRAIRITARTGKASLLARTARHLEGRRR